MKIDVPEFDLKKFGASNLVDGAPVPGSGEAVVHKFDDTPMIDRTYKMYYAGAQKRPDGNYCRPIFDSKQKVKPHLRLKMTQKITGQKIDKNAFRFMHMLEKETVKMFVMQLKLHTRPLQVGENVLPIIVPKLFIIWQKIWNFDDQKSLNVYPTSQVNNSLIHATCNPLFRSTIE